MGNSSAGSFCTTKFSAITWHFNPNQLKKMRVSQIGDVEDGNCPPKSSGQIWKIHHQSRSCSGKPWGLCSIYVNSLEAKNGETSEKSHIPSYWVDYYNYTVDASRFYWMWEALWTNQQLVTPLKTRSRLAWWHSGFGQNLDGSYQTLPRPLVSGVSLDLTVDMFIKIRTCYDCVSWLVDV